MFCKTLVYWYVYCNIILIIILYFILLCYVLLWFQSNMSQNIIIQHITLLYYCIIMVLWHISCNPWFFLNYILNLVLLFWIDIVIYCNISWFITIFCIVVLYWYIYCNIICISVFFCCCCAMFCYGLKKICYKHKNTTYDITILLYYYMYVTSYVGSPRFILYYIMNLLLFLIDIEIYYNVVCFNVVFCNSLLYWYVYYNIICTIILSFARLYYVLL